MLNNDIFVIQHDNEQFSVPLWHSDLIYEYKDEKIYVKCIPDISENITIDKNNNIHISIECKLIDIFKNSCIKFKIGKKELMIPSDKLYIKERQRYIFRENGISIIQSKNMLDTSLCSDIIFYIKII